MKTKLRIIYTALFFILLITEFCIALFAHDDFVRPYVGDMLVTVLICYFCRIFFPQGMRLLAVCVFAFAAAIEIGQYFDFVKILGLENSRFFSVLLGRTFSPADLICYAVGCAAFWGLEHIINRSGSPKR